MLSVFYNNKEYIVDPVTLKITTPGKFFDQPRWITTLHAHWNHNLYRKCGGDVNIQKAWASFLVVGKIVTKFPEICVYHGIILTEDKQYFIDAHGYKDKITFEWAEADFTARFG